MANSPRIGTWITVPHPTIVDLVARTEGLDWVCVDCEHSPVSRHDVQTAVTIIQGYGKKAFVRVNENRHAEIKFPLDAGVDGIIIPMVNSAAEARDALSHCLYPPEGNRGVGLARAQEYGWGFEDHLQKNLSDLEIFVQVEHINAVNDIEEIVSLPKLSGVFLGPYDLSGSMGIPGQFEDPRMKDAIKRVSDVTLASGKYLGAHVIPADHNKVREFQELGYNFIAFSIDTYFLKSKLNDEIARLRG